MTASNADRTIQRGLEHHRAGRLAEAEALYREALAADPDLAEAHHMLGVLAHQAGRYEEALERIDRATATNPNHAGRHNHAGLALLALGRHDAAIARFRRALRLRPDYAEAHNNLGTALGQVSRSADAIASFREALRLAPAFASASLNLGRALSEIGHVEEALASLVQARELENVPQFQFAFATALRAAPFDATQGIGGDPELYRLATRALSEGWIRPGDLAPACERLLMTRHSVRDALARAADGDAAPGAIRLSGSRTSVAQAVATLAREPLVIALLESAPVVDPVLERALTNIRAALLDDVLRGRAQEPGRGQDPGREPGSVRAEDLILAFRCSLARQCFINEYVFDVSDAEDARLTTLAGAIAARLPDGASATRHDAAALPEASLTTLAAYMPLHSIEASEAILAGIGRSSPPFAALVRQQIVEPREERALRDHIPLLTSIGTGASSAVRGQYEENPYPRWTRVARVPHSDLRAAPDGRPRTKLVAGCGTGQESIEVALADPGANVLAIDLSLASLAFAERRAREIGVTNLVHAQADLLRMAELGREFDVIYSVGVLHHLADPEAGVRVLASMLRADGSMLIGLYSESGRTDIAAVRRHIAASGYHATAGDIRRCRQDLLRAATETALRRVTRLRDFHSMSGCRDLLFHVEEHCFTLPQVASLLGRAGLRVVTLVAPSAAAREYARRFPDDPAMSDLAHWEAFEAAYPETFAGMYLLWVGHDSAKR